jgi:hypothetical protein
MELCKEVIEMAESAILSSKIGIVSDAIHKEGLIATLKDIIALIKEEGGDQDDE